MSSKVYFTDFRTQLDVSLTTKLQKLIRKAGIGEIDMDGKFVAIKMHFGELGNLAYLRPNYAKAVADVVKENGGSSMLVLRMKSPNGNLRGSSSVACSRSASSLTCMERNL